jgi:hypothetical protein
MSAVDEFAPPAGEGDDDLPIESYEQLTVAKVLPRLAGLTRAQLWQVHEFERRHANRLAVLRAIEQALA